MPSMTAICRQVGGLPLGLELAAAWIHTLSPTDIARELGHGLQSLETGWRNIPERHRSLRAVFDHSWHLLSPEEQNGFRRLAVFRSGFRREAAKQVADVSLAILSALVNKSILRRNADRRYEFHELLKQYGREKLQEAGETERMRDRHLAFVLWLAEEAKPKLKGIEQSIWLATLDAENADLQAGLEWAVESGKADVGLRLSVTLGLFWHMRGHLFGEGRAWLEKVLSRTEASEQTALRARGYGWVGKFARLDGDHAAAQTAFEKSLALFRELGDNNGIAESLHYLADFAMLQRDEGAMLSLYATARSFYDESLAVLRELGDLWKIALTLTELGEMARVEGDYIAARSFYEESLAIRRELGDERGMAVSLINLGYVAHYQGDYQQAATFLEESLVNFQKHGGKRGIVDCLAALAGVAGGMGLPEQAARLLGAVQALHEAFGTHIEHVDIVEYERYLAIARSQLDEAAFALAWAEGRTMTLEQAVAYALAAKPD
jgi:tetratricopeptide (TPR) repeat protein